MEPPGDLDVTFLLERRSQVHELLSGVVVDGDTGFAVGTLSLLSSRQETWDVHVLSVAGSLRMDVSAREVVDRFTGGDFGSIEVYLPAGWDDHASAAFAISARFVRYAFASDALVAAAVSTPRLEYCLKHVPPEEIEECLRG